MLRAHSEPVLHLKFLYKGENMLFQQLSLPQIYQDAAIALKTLPVILWAWESHRLIFTEITVVLVVFSVSLFYSFLK